MKTPPREFTFARETFNLYIETTEDGERLAREQADQARRDEERRQAERNHPTLALREQPDDLAALFGPPIFTYTRAQAVADGFQIEVTKTAQEAGIKFPMFITRAVWEAYVQVPEHLAGVQDEAGRLWDIVWMTRFAIIRSRKDGDRIPVALYFSRDGRTSRLIKLVAVCGPLDIDDPQPAITVMMPDED